MLLQFPLAAEAQNKKIDSLAQLIANEKTDTGRVRLINNKISLISNQNLDSGIFYGLRNVAEAHRIGYYNGELIARNRLATNYCYTGNYTAADSELAYLLKFVKPSKDSADIAHVYSNYGMMYGMQGKYDTSIQYYKKSLRLEEKGSDSSELGKTYTNISIGYQQLGNFATALYYQQKALRLAEKTNDETSQAYTLLNIGITYENIEDTLKAKSAYLKSAAIASKLSLLMVEMYANSNLAGLYVNTMYDWKNGYDYAIKSAAQAKQLGDAGMRASNLGKASVCVTELGDYKKAYELATQAILISDSSNQPVAIDQAQAAMGHLLYTQKRYAEAIPFYEKKFSLPGNATYSVSTTGTYKELSACYEKTGDYKKALSTYKKAAEITDSIKQKENIRKTTELSMNYDFTKKQEVLAAEKKKEDEITRTKQVALLVGLLLVLLLGVIAFAGYRNKQKANGILVTQKNKIETTLTELKKTQQQLIQSEKMASLGELTAGIAHEIQNPLNFVNNFSEVNHEMIDEASEEMGKGNYDEVKNILSEIKGNEQKIIHHGKRADAIVKSMLQHSRQTKGAKESADINALCNEYLKLSYHGLRAKDKTFTADLKTEFDETIGKISIVPQNIGRVLLNLFDNAFYALNEKVKLSATGYHPTLSVTTRTINGAAEIIISDNGMGIPATVIDKIFQPFFTTKPTGQGTGLGLSLAYDIITKEHGGTLTVESKKEEGTTFIITLPIA